MKYKILFITGSRAEYGLMRSTLLRMKKSRLIDLRLLATGMHTLSKYGLTVRDVKKDFPACRIAPIRGDDMLAVLAEEISGIKKYLEKNKPAAILVVGDRDEMFAGAIAGIHLNIPVMHISGGDESGPAVDQYLRDSITIFSKLHLVQTARSKKNVIALGADKKNTHIVGSAGLDQLKPAFFYKRRILARELKLKAEKEWLLVAFHPTPFEKESFTEQINSVLQAIKKFENEKEIIIIYPNSDTGSQVFIKKIEVLRRKNNYHIYKNIDRQKFLSLMYHSQAIIGNTSSGLIEAGYLKKPFILVGRRQYNREHGINTLPVPYNTDLIAKAIGSISNVGYQKILKDTKSIYRGDGVSEKIIKHIEKFLVQKYA